MLYPVMQLENQFGEVSNNYVKGGSILDLSFAVDSTNVNGLGISGLVGAGVKNVFMHTSATPLGGNPNPAAGYILIQLKAAYSGFLNAFANLQSPNSGANIAVTTGVAAGLTYVITVLGTTPVAGWHTLGVPAGVTPAVGVSFVGAATTTTTGTGQIQIPKAIGSGISQIEMIGDASTSAADATGAWLLFQVLAPTSSSVTTLVKANPGDGTVVKMQIKMAGVVQEP